MLPCDLHPAVHCISSDQKVTITGWLDGLQAPSKERFYFAKVEVKGSQFDLYSPLCF